MQELIFSVFPWETRAYVLESGVLENVFVEWSDEANVSGNIYEGRVDSISSSLGAAFLNIGIHKKAFLKLSDTPQALRTDRRDKSPIRVGDRIPVQVLSDVSDIKSLRVTQEISLVGRYLVFRPRENIELFSAKSRNHNSSLQFREKIKNCEFSDTGFILRSAYDATRPHLVAKEAVVLMETWEKIASRRKKSNFPGLLKKNISLPIRTLRDFMKAGNSKIWVNDAETFSSLKRFLAERVPQQSNCLKLSSRNISESKHKINDILSLAIDSRIELRSGGQIVIEKTEAMTTIDVNSRSFSVHKDPELVAFAVNFEASAEIIKQLRLKNIGGLIVIDFMNMREIKHRKAIRNLFEIEKNKDRKIGMISEFSDLGLLALSRRHTSRTLGSNFFEPCEVCSGTGKTKISKAICFEIFGEIVRNQDYFKEKVCIVYASSLLSKILNAELNPIAIEFFLSLDITIEIKEKSSFKKDDYKIVASTLNRAGGR
ncbi:hypothetical protein CBE37_02565 [bacterium TMED277]|nr:MAG: hypothetical protein CBE37_02565 [bacterium TMED277]